jgi:hypothetical protein
MKCGWIADSSVQWPAVLQVIAISGGQLNQYLSLTLLNLVHVVNGPTPFISRQLLEFWVIY